MFILLEYGIWGFDPFPFFRTRHHPSTQTNLPRLSLAHMVKFGDDLQQLQSGNEWLRSQFLIGSIRILAYIVILCILYIYTQYVYIYIYVHVINMINIYISLYTTSYDLYSKTRLGIPNSAKIRYCWAIQLFYPHLRLSKHENSVWTIQLKDGRSANG